MKLFRKKKRLRLAAIFLVLSACSLGFISREQAWEKSGHGIIEAKITCLAIHPQNSQIVFAGTENGIYKSNNKGKDFSRTLYSFWGRKVVNRIFINPNAPFDVYAATDDGVLASRDEGRTWKKIFDPRSPKEKDCKAVVRLGASVFVGTEEGIFTGGAEGAAPSGAWKRLDGVLGDAAIYFLATDAKYVYAATDHEIYRISPDGLTFEKIFSAVSREQNGEADTDEAADTNNNSYLAQIKTLATSAVFSNSFILLVTGQGIFKSLDSGETWQNIPQDSFRLNDVTSAVMISENDILIGSNQGAFLFQNNIWLPLYTGLETTNVTDLALGSSSGILAATDRGIFQLTDALTQPIVTQTYAQIQLKFQHEPTIEEVQTMAVAYAEVNKEKIDGWRKAAGKKAMLPTVSLGVSADKNRTIANSVYGSSSGGGSSYIGPNDKTFYNNLGLDVSVAWDLGELVWNNDQTSIDSRSKLLVELREDILDQVTRLYFERRRLQAQVLSAGQADADPALIFENEIRIAELTALLDGYTGGEFGRRVRSQSTVDSRQLTVGSEQSAVDR